jgi:hypothetical protein
MDIVHEPYLIITRLTITAIISIILFVEVFMMAPADCKGMFRAHGDGQGDEGKDREQLNEVHFEGVRMLRIARLRVARLRIARLDGSQTIYYG